MCVNMRVSDLVVSFFLPRLASRTRVGPTVVFSLLFSYCPVSRSLFSFLFSCSHIHICPKPLQSCKVHLVCVCVCVLCVCVRHIHCYSPFLSTSRHESTYTYTNTHTGIYTHALFFRLSYIHKIAFCSIVSLSLSHVSTFLLCSLLVCVFVCM